MATARGDNENGRKNKTGGRRKSSGGVALPPGAWQATEAVWGGAQRVRLVTGPPSLVGDDGVRVRSIHAVLFAQNNQNDVLLVQNKDGSWTFPGGRLEERETPTEALDRELWEEARATLAPGAVPVAATQITFLNRVPGRLHRVHPTFLLWVTGRVAHLSDEPHHDPANFVIGRRLASLDEARALLPPLECDVLDAALRTVI